MCSVAESFDIIKREVNRLEIPLGEIGYQDLCYEDSYFAEIFCQDTFKFNYGATRGCFTIPNDENIVFKFDLAGVSEPYCAIEADRYQEACIEGLEDVFLPVQLYATINNALVYVQPKVDRILGFDYDIKKKDYDEICEKLENYRKGE